jgi:hypothetical protein
MAAADVSAYKAASVGRISATSHRQDAVWKVFSNQMLTADDLAEIFEQPSDGTTWPSQLLWARMYEDGADSQLAAAAAATDCMVTATAGAGEEAQNGKSRGHDDACSRIRVVKWSAYPEYLSPGERFLPFKLAPNLAYTCAIERAASAVEV